MYFSEVAQDEVVDNSSNRWKRNERKNEKPAIMKREFWKIKKEVKNKTSKIRQELLEIDKLIETIDSEQNAEAELKQQNVGMKVREISKLAWVKTPTCGCEGDVAPHGPTPMHEHCSAAERSKVDSIGGVIKAGFLTAAAPSGSQRQNSNDAGEGESGLIHLKFPDSLIKIPHLWIGLRAPLASTAREHEAECVM